MQIVSFDFGEKKFGIQVGQPKKNTTERNNEILIIKKLT